MHDEHSLEMRSLNRRNHVSGQRYMRHEAGCTRAAKTVARAQLSSLVSGKTLVAAAD